MFNLLSHKKTPLVSGVITVLLFAFLFYFDTLIAETTDKGILAHQFSFTKSEALIILNSWGSQGRGLFLKTVWIDYLFPLAYATFLSSLILQQIQKNPLVRTGIRSALMITLPFLVAFLDMIENGYQIVQVMDTKGLPNWFFITTSVISTMKWVCALIVILILIFLYINNKRMKTKA